MHEREQPEPDPAPLTPIFLGLRIGLHTLMTGLTLFVLVRAIIAPPAAASWIVALSIVLLASYLGGAFLTGRGLPTTSGAARLVWLAAVSVEVLALLALTGDAAFLAFPLFFVQLHLLSGPRGVIAVLGTTVLAIGGLMLHNDWHVGAVLGPLIGAVVAIVIGLGYRALYRESQQRQRLIDELVATRAELARREHESGVLAERSRLAREIHDTVAQGLSSIQLLLHAAERDAAQWGDPPLVGPQVGSPSTALEHVRLARESAAEALAETRRFIRELSPPALEGQSLAAALSRLCAAQSRDGLLVSFHQSGDTLALPMRLEAALLRIAQGALANTVTHASAHRAEITLSYLDDWVGLDIVDDGVGFDPSAARTPAADGGSFGLTAIRQRVEQLGGSLSIESDSPGGTALAVGFDLDTSTEAASSAGTSEGETP